MDHGHGPRSVRIKPIGISVIECPAEEDTRIIVIAQRCPAEIGGVPIPMNPSRTPSPMVVRDPVPAEVGSPTPPAEVHRAPSPGLIRNPRPADNRIPQPAAVVIGAPIVVVDRRNPDVAVGRFFDPSSVIGQFVLVFGVGRGQIGGGGAAGVKRIPGVIPAGEFVAVRRERPGFGNDAPVFGDDPLTAVDQDRTLLPRHLGPTEVGAERRFFVIPDVDPIKARFEDIERSVGRVNLDVPFAVRRLDPKI